MQDGEDIKGCGPLMQPVASAHRPLRQQVFEHVRALGEVPRVQVARDLRVSPATVTTLTSELIEAGLLEEVHDRRDGEPARGRPAVALQVRAGAHHVMGLKLSDLQHTAVIADLSGKVLTSAVLPRRPGRMSLDAMVDAVETLMRRTCAELGLDPAGRGAGRL